MLKIDIPQRATLELHHAVFDVQGTLAVDGVALAGVAERLKVLSGQLSIHLLTTSGRSQLPEIERSLGFPTHTLHRGDEKMRYVQQLGPSKVVAIGNGLDDSAMLRLAALGIAVLTSEGLATRLLQAADVVVHHPLDALNLLLKPQRLIATLQD